MENLNELIIDWANKRGLVKIENTGTQSFKLTEEKGELFGAILKNNRSEIIDAIGDLQVVKIILCAQNDRNIPEVKGETKVLVKEYSIEKLLNTYDNVTSHIVKIDKEVKFNYQFLSLSMFLLDEIAERFNLDSEECLSVAYNVIKSRKGKTINGTFIKE